MMTMDEIARRRIIARRKKEKLENILRVLCTVALIYGTIAFCILSNV